VMQLYQMDQTKTLELLEYVQRGDIIWAYHPLATEGNIVYDIAGQAHAVMNGSIKSILTHGIKNAFYCAGGLRILYPIFFHIDDLYKSPPKSEQKKELNLAFHLLSLIHHLFKNFPSNQQAAIDSSDVEVLSYLLDHNQTQYLDEQIFQLVIQIISSIQPDYQQLSDEFLTNILFNFQLWTKTSYSIQRAFLLGPLMSYASNNTEVIFF